jgi:hypothetical protein
LIAECNVGALHDDPAAGAEVRISIDPQWIHLVMSEC